ncbi:MAG: hypothetical protein Q7U60_09060, partial [Candidatus Methanoperedens sp.]|nr:hypothetical protein [Candidatus Methanoperedens sp.]
MIPKNSYGICDRTRSARIKRHLALCGPESRLGRACSGMVPPYPSFDKTFSKFYTDTHGYASVKLRPI